MNNNSMSVSPIMKRQSAITKQAEAKSRRKIAKDWEYLGKSKRYQKFAVKESCQRSTSKMKEELYDGILLNLRDHSMERPLGVRKRILRRIVEKRIAQSAHQSMGRTDDRQLGHLQLSAISRSLRELHRNTTCESVPY